MKFNTSLDYVLICLISVYLSFYLLYFIRLAFIPKAYKTNYLNVSLKFIIRTLAVCCFSIAYLQPYHPVSNKNKLHQVKGEHKAKDVYFLLDISASMKCKDVAPNRFLRAKTVIKKVAKELNGDNLGLIVFPYFNKVFCPITHDFNAFNEHLEILTKTVEKSTDFAPPLELSLNKHKENKLSSKAKIMVFISDGEDFGEKTKQLAKAIKEENIKVFTVGIGTTSGGKIPEPSGYKKDNNGQFIHTKLNRASLQQLSLLTKGKYYEVNSSINQQDKLIHDLKKLDGISRESKDVSAKGIPKHHLFIIGGLLLLILDLIFISKVIKL